MLNNHDPSSSDTKPTTRKLSFCSMRHLFLLVILGLVALNLSQALRGRGWLTSSTKGGYNIVDDNDDKADVIIQRPYANLYAQLLPCKDEGDAVKSLAAVGMTSNLCNPKLWTTCMKKNLLHFNNERSVDGDSTTITSSTPPPSIPCRLQTLLCVHGFWHHFSTTLPPPTLLMVTDVLHCKCWRFSSQNAKVDP